MTPAAPRALSWCFDLVDISAFMAPPAEPRSPDAAGTGGGDPLPTRGLTVSLLLDLLFAEFAPEPDRPVRDRLNEALRQWHLRTFPKPA